MKDIKFDIEGIEILKNLEELIHEKLGAKLTMLKLTNNTVNININKGLYLGPHILILENNNNILVVSPSFAQWEISFRKQNDSSYLNGLNSSFKRYGYFPKSQHYQVENDKDLLNIIDQFFNS